MTDWYVEVIPRWKSKENKHDTSGNRHGYTHISAMIKPSYQFVMNLKGYQHGVQFK